MFLQGPIGGSDAVHRVVQTVARVDMHAPLGSAAARGEVERTAYSPLERVLTRLEALAGILPACPPEHAEIYRWACFEQPQTM